MSTFRFTVIHRITTEIEAEVELEANSIEEAQQLAIEHPDKYKIKDWEVANYYDGETYLPDSDSYVEITDDEEIYH